MSEYYFVFRCLFTVSLLRTYVFMYEWMDGWMDEWINVAEFFISFFTDDESDISKRRNSETY